MKIILLALTMMGFLGLTGCANTMEGLGKDIEKIGQEIQGETEEKQEE